MEASRKISPEGKQRLSDLMTKRHQRRPPGHHLVPHFTKENASEMGRRGAAARDRNKQRITKRVAEAAAEEENARQIIEVFKDAVHPNQPMHVRLKGAQAWADIARQHAQMELQEDAQDAAQHSREELLEILSKGLTSGPSANVLRRQLESSASEPIVDAEVIEP